MDSIKLVNLINESFLSPLLNDKDITDISYNGQDIYYQHNYLGRRKSDITIDVSSAKDFVRQIANLSDKQFSFQNPKLDVSVGKYRINAVHPSIARRNNEPCLHFNLRIASDVLLITNESPFLNAKLISLIRVLLRSKMSIVIGGQTGSGKTEFQKYLISQMEDYTRIIVIDSVLELDMQYFNENLDINIWQADERNNEFKIQELVKNALRCNPDWLIVAESRGKEMVEVLNSAMTGHPIITTIHALNIDSMPTRIGRMVMMNEQNTDFETLMQDIYYHFRFFFYLKRMINNEGRVLRFIEEIAEIDENGHKHTIYMNNLKKEQFFPIRNQVLELLDYKNDDEFKKYFVKEEKA